MIEKQIYFWEEASSGNYDGIVCTINQMIKKDGCLIMGAGIAKQFAEKFPKLPEIWGDHVQNKQSYITTIFTPLNKLGYENQDKYVIGLPTKIHFAYNSDIGVIKNSCAVLRAGIEALGLQKVLMPKPGCGLGKLEWDNVKSEIESFLNSDKIVVVDNNPWDKE